MSRHAATRTPRWRFGQGRTRALLGLGALTVLGATATMAYWTDEATIGSSTIQTGTLDLTAGPTTGSEFLTGTGPNTWSYSAYTISDMVPGESLSRTFVVRNSGTAAFRFNATAQSSTNDLTSGTSGLKLEVYDSSTAAAATGSQANGNRAGACSGGSLVFSGFVSTTASGNVFTTPPVLSTNGATRNLCVRAELNSAAPNALQGKSTTISLNLTATQVAAP